MADHVTALRRAQEVRADFARDQGYVLTSTVLRALDDIIGCALADLRETDPDGEEETNRRIEEHERWLGTEGADHLFENGRGE